MAAIQMLETILFLQVNMDGSQKVLLKNGIEIHGEAGLLELKNDTVVFLMKPSWHKLIGNLVRKTSLWKKMGILR